MKLLPCCCVTLLPACAIPQREKEDPALCWRTAPSCEFTLLPIRSETAINDQRALAWGGQTWHSGEDKIIIRAPQSLPSLPTELYKLWEKWQPSCTRMKSQDRLLREVSWVCCAGTGVMLILPRKCPAHLWGLLQPPQQWEVCAEHRHLCLTLVFSWDVFPKFSWARVLVNLILNHKVTDLSKHFFLCRLRLFFCCCCIKIAPLCFHKFSDTQYNANGTQYT